MRLKKQILVMLIFTMVLVNFETVQANKQMSVFIDPGHGGYDSGARTEDGILEKDLNLNVSLYLRNFLENVGIKVYMTRENDTDYVTLGRGTKKRRDLNQRIEMINSSDALLLVSIHMNSLPVSRWHGAQTFFDNNNPESRILASSLQKSLIEVLKNTDREQKEVTTLFLLKSVKIPAALVEAGFLSNPMEKGLLQEPQYQEKVAFAIFLGIIDYLYND